MIDQQMKNLLHVYLPYFFLNFIYCCIGESEMSTPLRVYSLMCGLVELYIGIYSINEIIYKTLRCKNFKNCKCIFTSSDGLDKHFNFLVVLLIYFFLHTMVYLFILNPEDYRYYFHHFGALITIISTFFIKNVPLLMLVGSSVEIFNFSIYTYNIHPNTFTGLQMFILYTLRVISSTAVIILYIYYKINKFQILGGFIIYITMISWYIDILQGVYKDFF